MFSFVPYRNVGLKDACFRTRRFPFMTIRHVLSFGGGVNSIALMVVLLREGLPFDEAVFADTGGEVPETYQYVETATQYLADHEVPLTVVSKRGRSLYEPRGTVRYSRQLSGDGQPEISRSHRSTGITGHWIPHQPIPGYRLG